MNPRFLCETPVIESFTSDLLRAILNYWRKSNLESKTSKHLNIHDGVLLQK